MDMGGALSQLQTVKNKMVFLGQVLVFGISTCPFCRRTKKLLSDLEVPYVDVNLEKYPERRYEMEERTGRRTVPQIFFNNKHIGGFDNLKKLVSGASSTHIFIYYDSRFWPNSITCGSRYLYV